MKLHKKLNKLYAKKKKGDDVGKKIKETKDKLYKAFGRNKKQRRLNHEAINKKNIVSVFESTLTRTLGLEENKVYEDIIIVRTYFFNVIEDIILHGFIYNNEKYVVFTASAGQIRTKKTVFIKEKLLKKYQNSLMCGLTIEEINRRGGVNINKYLAYLALTNSATDLWEEFDITKSIVVDDMETMVNATVDFINDETYEIERKSMDIPITHTDGAGMILPSKSRKNMMVRLPWVKGLVVSFPYDKFIREANRNNPEVNHGLIKDIYGKEHDILKEGIEVIFTKSQFKMWKYYDSWEDYIEKYLKFKCQAGKCNEEEDEFSDAKINYQMLQTLIDMSDEEIEEISRKTKEDIYKIGRDRKTMLRVFGVVKSNTKKTHLQQALEIYPELLSDIYTKEVLRQIKKSMVREGRAAKLDIEGKYTFICPDMYAFCEYLFLGDKNPQGLLNNGEVYCKLFKGIEKLDCLRSPHLYREHAVRKNIIDKEKGKWFTTNGLYTSIHDPISKILMFDVDGDKSLVCAEKTIVDVAERNMKDIVPLYYNMRKAGAERITNQTIYNGLKLAYTGGNIGMISNDITKIWNNDNVNLDAIKLLCMENNFTIDYAKTLYKPTRPKDKNKEIVKYTKHKTPYFFVYAKNKEKDKVEETNKSVVNRLGKIIPNPNINFKATNLGKFNHKILMRNKKIELDMNIIQKYTELDKKKHFMIRNADDEEYNNIAYIYKDIRDQLLELNHDIYYISDVLIEYLYNHKNSKHKDTLWLSFGEFIVENLKNNIKEGYKLCEICGGRIEDYNSKKYCETCANEKEIKRKREWKRKSKIKIGSENE